jgi:hypothetical protein
MIDSVPTPKQAVIQMVQEMPDTATYNDILSNINTLHYEFKRKAIGQKKIDFLKILDTEFLNYKDDSSKLAAEILVNYLAYYKMQNNLQLTSVQRAYMSFLAADGLIGNGGFLLVFHSLHAEMDNVLEDIQKIHSPSGEVFKNAYVVFKKYEKHLKDGNTPPEWEKDENHPDSKKLDELDSAWYALEKEREEFAYKYFRQNKEGFELEKMKEYFEALKK